MIARSSSVPVILATALSCLLLASFNTVEAYWPEMTSIKGSGDIFAKFGSNVDIDGDTAVATQNSEFQDFVSKVHVYERVGETGWGESATLTQQTSYMSKATASIHGNRIAFGICTQEDDINQEGLVQIYEKKDGEWEFVTLLTAHPARRNERFGSAVLLTDDWLFVGMPGTEADNAAVYIFSTSTWSQVAALLPTNNVDWFGSKLAFDDNTLVVGGLPTGNSALDLPDVSAGGALYIYNWNGSLWQRETRLTSGNNPVGFGLNVAMFSNKLFIAQPVCNGSGKCIGTVAILEHNGNQWDHGATTIMSPTYASQLEHFGFSMAPAEHGLFVACPSCQTSSDSNLPTGAVFLYEESEDGYFTLMEHFVPAGLETMYGQDVACSGNIVIIGASGDESAVYIYAEDTTTFTATGGPSIPDKKLIPKDDAKNELSKVWPGEFVGDEFSRGTLVRRRRLKGRNF